MITNFLHLTLLQAGLRNALGICPPEIMRFLLDLFKYNDNTKNHYSDVYYRSCLIDALGDSITPVIAIIQQGTKITSENLSADAKLVLEEVTKILNLEKHLPSYKYLLTVSCLKVIRKLQKCGHLPPNSKVFRSYTEFGHYIDVRAAAFECLVDYIKADGKWDDIEYMMELLENDQDPEARHKLARAIIENPPFERNRSHRLNRFSLRERIWKNMNATLSHDTRLRCDMVDIYYTLFGLKEPSDIKDPEIASLYKPQKVEPPRDILYDDVKIELDEQQIVHVKDFVPGPSIEDDYKSIEIETELVVDTKVFSTNIDEDDVHCMTIETPVENLLVKDEAEDFMVIDTKVQLSDVEINNEPMKKKAKMEYLGSDNSVSQPGLDVGDFNLEGASSATMFSGETKEHKVHF